MVAGVNHRSQTFGLQFFSFCLFIIFVCSAPGCHGTTSVYNQPCGTSGTQMPWESAGTWSNDAVPDETSQVFISGCTVVISESVSVAVINIDELGHLIILNSNVTVSGSINVNYGHLTLAGPNSRLTAPKGLAIEYGALTGSATIIGNVDVSGRSELDVFEVSETDLLPQRIGTLTIHGNLTMRRRDPLAPNTTTELYHATVALGLAQFVGINYNSKLRVNGRIFIQKMSLSLLFTPDNTTYGSSLPPNLIVADAGFVLDPSISDPARISTQVIPRAGRGNFDRIPFPYGHHVGRYSPNPNLEYGGGSNLGGPDGGGEGGSPTTTIPPSSGCSQPSGSSLVILFGASQCSAPVGGCASGLIYDSTTLTCVPQCPDMTCSGHGTCAASNGAATCSCSFGWTGSNCQLGDCPIYQGAVCNLRGTCNVPAAPGQPATCSCQSGFAEPDCRPPITLTPTPTPDSTITAGPSTGGGSTSGGSGTPGSSGSPSSSGSDGNTLRCGSIECARAATACSASNTSCVCVQGFGGVACEQAQCPNQCSGHGVCDGSRVPPVCQCTGNWLGDDCNTAGGAAATDNNNNTNGGLASQSIAGISAPAFIGIMAAVGLIVLVAIVVIIVVAVNKTAKRAVRPFAAREVTRDDDL